MPDNLTSARAASPAWLAELYALKRTVYTIYLGASAVIVGLLLVFPLANVEASTWRLSIVIIPMWIAFAGALIVAMWRRPSRVVLVERLMYAVIYPVVVGSGVAIMTTGSDPERFVEYVYASALWMSIGYIWAFVAFGKRHGLLAAGALLVTYCAAVNVAAAFGPHRDALDGVLPIDVLFVTTNATLILALYVMSAFIELQSRGREAAESLARFATEDALTGLPNRRALDTRLAADLAAAKRDRRALAVCFVDLDDLKGVNDTYGHRGGDELIKTYGDRLRAAVREADLVARISGDEFVVAGFVRGRDDAEALAHKLLGATAEPFTIAGDHTIAVGSSVGVSLYPDDAVDAAELLRQADVAMYAAKLAGKNRWRSAAGRGEGRPKPAASGGGATDDHEVLGL